MNKIVKEQIAFIKDCLNIMNDGNYETLKVMALLYINRMEKQLNLSVVIRQSEQLKEKKTRDIINWVKSDLAQEQNNKLAKTQTPYRIEKIRFLRKLESLMSDL